jgi:hypothetical protein
VTDDSAASTPAGPTVVLIGGRMTVDDGSTLDSRQQVEGDPESRVTRSSLANSLLWWTTTSSLVEPLLDTAGPESFALVIGPRSVVELRHDGTLRRTRLRSLLPSATSTVELVRTSMNEPLPDGYDEVTTIRASNGQSLGTVGISPRPAGRRWRFLNGNEYYLSFAGPQIGPAVIVDTSDSFAGGAQFNWFRFHALERRRLFSDDTVLVLPHTHSSDVLLRGYVAWVQAQRPGPEPTLPPTRTRGIRRRRQIRSATHGPYQPRPNSG